MGKPILSRGLAALAISAVIAGAGAARADIIFHTDEIAFGADDTFTWNAMALGGVPNGAALAAAGGTPFTVANGGGNLAVSDNPNFFISNGGVDQFLVSPLQPNQVILIDLAPGVFGFGTTAEWGGFEVGSYKLSAFGAGNVLLGSTTIPSGASGDPRFLGVLDTTGANIVAVTVAFDGPTAPHSAALGDFLFRITAPDAPIPEPGTWALMIAGFALTGAALRTRRAVVT